MPVATSPSALLPTSPVVKMEDRKRPAINADEIAPPSKRQQVNGSNKARDNAVDMGDEAWIEVSTRTRFQSSTPNPPSLHCHHPWPYPHHQKAVGACGFSPPARYLVSRDARRRESLLTRSVLMRGLLASACRAARSTNAPQPLAGMLLPPTLNGRYTHPSMLHRSSRRTYTLTAGFSELPKRCDIPADARLQKAEVSIGISPGRIEQAV